MAAAAAAGGCKQMTGKYDVVKQVVITNKAAYATQEIFGNEEDEDQEECVICLCDPKDTILMPCRHLCVCSSCFARLELCPVCRSPFTAYLRKPVAQEETGVDGDGEGAGEGGLVMSAMSATTNTTSPVASAHVPAGASAAAPPLEGSAGGQAGVGQVRGGDAGGENAATNATVRNSQGPAGEVDCVQDVTQDVELGVGAAGPGPSPGSASG